MQQYQIEHIFIEKKAYTEKIICFESVVIG